MTDVPYTHGHHDSVLRSHRWRTAANSAAYLLPRPRARDWPCSTWAAGRAPSPAIWPGGWLRAGWWDRCLQVVIEEARAVAGDGDRRRSPSRWVTCSTCASTTTPSTSSTPTRCSSTWGTRWPLSPRCGGCAGPGGVVAVRDSDYPGIRFFPDEPELDRAIAAYGAADPGQRCQLGRRSPTAALGQPGRLRLGGPLGLDLVLRHLRGPGLVGGPVGRPVHPVGSRPTSWWTRHRRREDLRRSPPPGGAGPHPPTVGSPCFTAR